MCFLNREVTFLVTSTLFLFILIMLIPAPVLSGGDFEKIKKELNSGDTHICLAAVEKLSNRTDEEAVNLLITVTGTPSKYWQVRSKAILLLGETKDPKAKEILLSIFTDLFIYQGCPAIRSYTATALGNFRGDTRVVNALINALDDSENHVRVASIQSLGKIGDPKAVPHLINHLSDSSFAIRISTIEALENIEDPQAIIHLKRLAENDTDFLVKSRAREALNILQRKKHDVSCLTRKY